MTEIIANNLKLINHLIGFILILSLYQNHWNLGLKYVVRKFPRGLLTGSCPLSWTVPNTPHTPSTKVKRPQTINPHQHENPVGQSVASTTRSRPGPIVRFDTREQFTNHDIEELNTQLEKNYSNIKKFSLLDGLRGRWRLTNEMNHIANK